MLVENQKVNVKWNNKHKKYFQSLGYTYTKTGDEFEVILEHLKSGSNAEVKVKCDYCNYIFLRPWKRHILAKENDIKLNLNKDCCKSCYGLKMREVHGTLNELEFLEDDSVKDLKVYSEQDLINSFFKYKEEFGIYPKRIDMESHSDYPSAHSYFMRWGNWTNFINTLGIMTDDGWYKEDEQIVKNYYNESEYLSDLNSKMMIKYSSNEINKKASQFNLKLKTFIHRRDYDVSNKEKRLASSLDGIVDLFSDLGKYPTTTEYDAYAKLNGLLLRRNLIDTLGKNFTKICSDVIGGSNKDSKEKEVLLKELFELKEKLGRTPLANELKLHGLSEKKTYMRKFDMRYQELITSLGWELATPKLKHKSDEELLSDYEKLHKDLKRLPNHEDIDNCRYTASRQTYAYRFGSLKNVWDILNLEYCPSQDLSSGNVYINKNNELCRSNAELLISELLIDNDIKYTSEYKYSKINPMIKSKWISDWYLQNEKICVEYFGMFDERHLKRNTRMGRYSRKVKNKIKACERNNIKLIELYPQDLENNFEGLIKKFAELNIAIKAPSTVV